MNTTEFKIRLEGSGRSRNLIYEEKPDRKLVLFLDMSGKDNFNWVGSQHDISAWSEPQGGIISPQKRDEILNNIRAWSKLRNKRIDI